MSTSPPPATCDGEVTEQVVFEVQLTPVPAVLPELTVVAPGEKPVPVMVTGSPPVGLPATGLTEVTVSKE
jgi:hypothetical protein